MICVLGVSAFALACGRTSLHRCDLAGCRPGTICADAGVSIEDSGSQLFCCVLPDSGRPCTGVGDSCLDYCAGPCCGGMSCNSNGICAANPDAGP